MTENKVPSENQQPSDNYREPFMPFFKWRMIETLVITVITSLIASGLFFFGVFEMVRNKCVIVLIICMIIDIVLFHIYQRRYLFTVFNIRIYLRVNIAVVLMISLSALLLAYLNAEPFFTFLFSPYKLWNIAFGFSKVKSVLITSGIYLLTTLITPAIS